LNPWTFLVVAVGLLLAPGLAAASDDAAKPGASAPDTPFPPGEELAYELRLLGIKAGEAKFRVEADALEPELLRFEARGRSLGAADSLFRLRQSASCEVDRTSLALRVCRVATQQRTGDRRREFVVDRSARNVRERLLQDGKPREKVVEFGDGIDRVQEALSGLYLLRARLPEAGRPQRFMAVRKNKPITVEATNRGTSVIETPAGRFEAVEVRLAVIEGEGEEGETAGSLWFSADARRLPVKLSFDAKVGTLEARLVDARGTLAVAPRPAADPLQASAKKE
jgi:hypothetical protein